eukprot:8819678-Alexandrium_andersonii.AAC.1
MADLAAARALSDVGLCGAPSCDPPRHRTCTCWALRGPQLYHGANGSSMLRSPRPLGDRRDNHQRSTARAFTALVNNWRLQECRALLGSSV